MKKENKILAQQKREQAAQKAKSKRIVMIVAIVLVCVLAACALYLPTIFDFNTLTSWTPKLERGNYSAYITPDGSIKNYDAVANIELADYMNITVNSAAIRPTGDEVDEQVAITLESYADYSEDTSLEVEYGDKVKIEFTGTMNGETFTATNGTAQELEIGSGNYIPGFEDELVGALVGESVNFDITFPEDYTNAPDLAGQRANFDVTIVSKLVTPELTDEFVAENLSEYASTAEEYEQYVYDGLYDINLKNAISTYIVSGSTVNNMNPAYLKHTQRRIENENLNEYAYYNNMSYEYTGEYAWSDLYDYLGVEKAEYKDNVEAQALSETNYYAIMSAIYEKENLPEMTEDEIVAYWLEMGYSYEYDNLVETFGEGFAKYAAKSGAVLEYLTDKVTVVE